MRIDINGRPAEAQPGETLLTAIRRAGVTVPTLCHLEGLLPTGACRLCVVEIEGQKGLVPSCSYPVSEGMKVRTHSQRAVKSRKAIVELLLSNHPDDCLYCVRNGSCQLQGLSEELGVHGRRFTGLKRDARMDVSGPALAREPGKCILCGKCVRVCEEVQGVGAIDFIGRGSATKVGPAFDQALNLSSCVLCGQCVMVCPTGALHEQSHVKRVLGALSDPDLVTVVQFAPAVAVTLGEAYGYPLGHDVGGKLVAALRRLGFARVFETAFSADLTIMEEASELVERVKHGGPLPMMTSCSPGWIKFVEEFYPEFTAHLSTCKSPQQMLGALVKTHYAQREGIAPDKVFSVAVMPCTAKKFEASRPEMTREGLSDIDAVLTTRELVELIRMHGLDQDALDPEEADRPFGERSSAGRLFGATGGVMEAAVRTAHHLLTGRELQAFEVPAVRGLEGVKETKVLIGGHEVGLAVASGLGNARKLLEQVKAGRTDLHFIEVMTCPGGCVAGGGQLLGADPKALKSRMETLYATDAASSLRVSHKNEAVAALYRDFLGEPLGVTSHELLHTHYAPRRVVT